MCFINAITYFSKHRNKEGVAKNAADIAHLMRMAKELENKSTEDEMKVSENNVTIENLTMNVAMQNRTVVNMMEDRKCLLIWVAWFLAVSFIFLTLI